MPFFESSALHDANFFQASGLAWTGHAFAETTAGEAATLTGKIELLSYHEFSRWVPSEEIDGFWSNDGWFYMAVLPIANNWQPIEVKNQEKNLKLRYVKIRPAENTD
jgi:hypothetical protein